MTVKPLLIYPENKDIAVSNLAVHWFFNAFEKYSPDLLTLDSDRGIIDGAKPINSPFIFVSISYGLSYINFAGILKKYGIPLLKKDRSSGMFPIMIAGGIAVLLNPEPLTQIFDAVFLGEGECMEEDIKKILEMETRDNVFDFINRLDYAMTDEKIKAYPVIAEQGAFFVHSNNILHKFGNCFNNRLIVEMNRGCTSRCRFCAASYAYKIFRETDCGKVMELVDTSISEKTGIALMGTSLASVSCFDEIIEKCAQSAVSISLSSMKITEITEKRISMLKKCGVKTVTVAVESACIETREKILKKITDDDIINAMEILDRYQIKSRIYLIAGLPGTDPRNEAVKVLELLEKLNGKGLIKDTALSIAPFGPKPLTPFENEPMMTKKEYKLYMETLKRGLNSMQKRVKVEFFSYKESELDVLFGKLKGEDFVQLIYDNI